MSKLPKRRFNIGIVLLVSLISLAKPLRAIPTQAMPAVTWPTVALSPLITTGLSLPVHLTHARDNSGRIFIIEQAGRIKIYKDNTLLATPFLDISNQVRSPVAGGGHEEGLLSLAFSPAFAERGTFYVYYTKTNGDNVVSRFNVSSDPDIADPASEIPILAIPHPNETNHNGGQIAFGPDGYLYIATGDGGGAGDPYQNGQNTNTLLGKILRIDVEPHLVSPPSGAFQLFFPIVMKQSSTNQQYLIPPDNPFAGQPNRREEIWAYGLRNPWRFSFDRLTGDIYIGDVGQNNREEVDFQPASSPGGENYGWNIMEGSLCYNNPLCDPTGLVLPVAEYNHSVGCSITGGMIYRGTVYPALQGIYFYGDYCQGRIFGLVNESGTWVTAELLDTTYFISSFGEDESGEVYVVHRSGAVYRIILQ